MDKYFLDKNMLPSLIPDYLPRDSQIRAAKFIYESFKKNETVVLEAPTGSGKTMAYLIPIFDRAKRSIVSTKTKQLMNQLHKKDIPIMLKLFGQRNIAVLKGRKNYFCPQRFNKWIYNNSFEYSHVVKWYESNLEEILELPPNMFDIAILDKMSADSYQCLQKKCVFLSSCPFLLAKEMANKADIIITNHNLVLADFALRQDGNKIFQKADSLIFDEAHSISDIFARYAGVELSVKRFLYFLENYRTQISFEDYHDLMALAEKLFQSVEEKIEYSKIGGLFGDFFDFVRSLTISIEDEDLYTEFMNYENDFFKFISEIEGLRYAERKFKDVIIRFIPDDTGYEFKEGLKELTSASLMVSATLTSNGSFKYFLSQLGMSENEVAAEKMPSVFKMKNQAILYIPNTKEQKDLDNLLLQLLGSINGSALIICNSISRMGDIVSFLSTSQHKRVMSQNEGDWSSFTETKNMILVGCASLREGIDLAGSDFKCVIIDKLPFESPGDMYIKYKMDKVEAQTGSAFQNFNLPRAVIYFKQAAGRLIRHEKDLGILAVFDYRLLSTSYKNSFLEALDNINITQNILEAVNFIER